MICRLWRGWATHQNADADERIVREQVIPGIEARRIPGFRSIDLARRESERDVEFITLMWSGSLDTSARTLTAPPSSALSFSSCWARRAAGTR